MGHASKSAYCWLLCVVITLGAFSQVQTSTLSSRSKLLGRTSPPLARSDISMLDRPSQVPSNRNLNFKAVRGVPSAPGIQPLPSEFKQAVSSASNSTFITLAQNATPDTAKSWNGSHIGNGMNSSFSSSTARNSSVLRQSRITNTSAVFQISRPGTAASSSSIDPPLYIQNFRQLSVVPSGFIRATGELAFGVPSANSYQHSLNRTLAPLPTAPPAPPLRPDGLDLAGLQAIQVTNSSWTTNTSITTFSPGGSKPTVVPVIVKAAGVGLVLFGLSAAQEIVAPLGEVAEAAEIAEEEATGEEVEDEDEKEQDPTSSTRSTTSKTYSSTSSSPTSSSITSSTMSTTASSSTTSYSSSSSSSSSSLPSETCSNPANYPVLGDSEDDKDDKEVENSKSNRSFFGGMEMARRQLEQLGTYVNMKKPLTRLGSCKLDEMTDLPPFWKANSLMGKPGNSPNWYMPVPEDPNDLDAVPTYTTAATVALRTLSPSRKNVIIGGSTGYRTNVDHVYEVSLLKNFFNYYLTQKSVCSRFNSEYMAKSSNKGDVSRLAIVFAQLPGSQFGGLAGMDQRLNSIKAYFFQAGEIQHGLGFQTNGLCDSIHNLQLAGMVMDMLHSAEMKRFFGDANSRIYQALLGVDKAIAKDASAKCNRSSKDGFSWAAEYRYWIDWFLKEREFEIRNWAKNTQNAIVSELKQRVTEVKQGENGHYVTILDPVYDDDRKRMNAILKSPYGQSSHWTFNFNLHYPTDPLPMAKRGDDLACNESIDTSSTSTSSELPSPIALSTVAETTGQAIGSAAPENVVQPHKAPVLDSTVHFINDGQRRPESPESANHLNNENSANEFNNAIQSNAVSR